MNVTMTDTTEHNDGRTVETVGESVETDPLAVLVGDHPRARILIALLDAAPNGLNPTSITEDADIGARSTVYNHLDDLRATGLVVEDKQASAQAGASTVYKIADVEDDERTAWLGKLRDFTGKELREGGYYGESEDSDI
jgi:DNA-binding transcriptional ArsR family regulator